MELPGIIQGGMGVAISHWRLARSVCSFGHLGVVSGVGIENIMCARLNDGDPDGKVREALAAFPFPGASQRVLENYFIEGGRAPDQRYRQPPMWTATPTRERSELGVLGGFMEVWLAKQGHSNPVGINLLEKAQLSNLSVLYGGMLAGVDVVIVGAGIPVKYPGLIDSFCRHEAVSYPLDVRSATKGREHELVFEPREIFDELTDQSEPLARPKFFPIISSNTLAMALVRRANGPIDGLIVEAPVAGGHNAPPRGACDASNCSEPVYTQKDAVNLEKLKALGLPFWLAGGQGSAAGLREARRKGAQGIQVGTAFAFCSDSGMEPRTRQRVIDRVLDGSIRVRTDSRASPTNFPFKIVDLDGSAASSEVREKRRRVCDFGVLRHAYEDEEGVLGYRCPAEPVSTFVSKGGDPCDTDGRICLCNGLIATAGFPQQRRNGYVEAVLVTAGDDVANLARFLPAGKTSYSARDVIEELSRGKKESG